MPVATLVKPFREVLLGGKLRVNLHQGQTIAWDASERYVVVSAGTQSGKTCLGPHWLKREIDYWLNSNPTESVDFMAVSATFPLMNLKMLPEFLQVFKILLRLGEYKASDRVFESSEKLRGGSLWKVFLGSAENPDSLESATARAAWLDEPGQKRFKRESMEAIDRRVSLHQGRILFTTTPYVFGWFKREVYDRAMRGDPGYKMVNFRSTMNPNFPQAEYETQKAKLPRWKFRMFYDGVFERPAGQIYDSFNVESQVIKRFEIPLSWPRYAGQDFGPVHTAAGFYAAEPATGNIFLYRTCKSASKMSVHENVVLWRSEMHKDATGKIDEQIFKRVGGAKGESGWRDAYAAEGWPIAEPKITGPGSVELQIDRVYALHKLNKIFVFDDLKEYLDEKESFSRELDDSYKPTDKIEDEADYHYLAAERYILSDFTPETVARHVTPLPPHRNYLRGN
jgi:hypothetical protein